MKRALIALLVVGSVAGARRVARADPPPDLSNGGDGIAAWLKHQTGEC